MQVLPTFLPNIFLPAQIHCAAGLHIAAKTIKNMKKLSKSAKTSQLPVEVEKTGKELQWDINHAKIAAALANYIEKNGSLPSKSQIAQAAGLSRETVYKHIKAFTENPGEYSTLNSYSVMTEHVIAGVLRAALRGDLNASRLFLETTKAMNAAQPASRQNNYVQINKTVINQQIIQQLKPEQLNRLEQLIAAELNTGTVDNG
jgi:DNA-binding phage protein